MWRWWRWWEHPHLAQRVILNFKHDPSTAIGGVLWDTRGPWLHLRDAVLLKAKEEVPLDGNVTVHRADVAFYQVP